jgi:methyl-accepting chemotaxis protein
MALQVDLLESSFRQIVPVGEEFVTAFYERLFTRYPQTQVLFASTDLPEQRKKLLGSLALVVQYLRQPEQLAATLQALGKRHLDYQVRPEHYPMVGSVLLETFAAFLGEGWTPAYQEAWSEAYGAITGLMLDGGTPA